MVEYIPGVLLSSALVTCCLSLVPIPADYLDDISSKAMATSAFAATFYSIMIVLNAIACALILISSTFYVRAVDMTDSTIPTPMGCM